MFLYMFNIFLYAYGPCVCNKDILLLLLLLKRKGDTKPPCLTPAINHKQKL